MDTLLSLKVFASVAEHKSFAAVARRLDLSPAMTSKHVKHVESRVGARLLNRNSRNVSLTEAGARYLESVRPLLEELDDVEAQLSQTTLAAKGTLKISMPIWMANPSFTRILSAYRDENPNVTLDLDLSSRMVNMVEEGIDLALRVTGSLGEGLIMRKLTDVHFQLIASPELINEVGKPTSISDLNGKPFLAYAPMIRDGQVRFSNEQGPPDVQFQTVLLSENETLIRLAACEAMGFAFQPHFSITDDIKSGALERVLPEQTTVTVPLRAIYPDRTYLPAKVRSFLDFLAGPKGFASITL